MPPSTVAGIITAISAVIGTSGAFILALAVFIPILRRTKRTEESVGEVHVMVNQELTNRKNYEAALIRQLLSEGFTPVQDQSEPSKQAKEGESP
jgi:hypothetical protein